MPTPSTLEVVGRVWGCGVSCARGLGEGNWAKGTDGTFGGFPGSLFTGGIGVGYPVEH